MQIDNQLLIDTALFIVGYLAALKIVTGSITSKGSRTCKR